MSRWRVALLDDGMDLHGMDVTCLMVYWADSLYDKPVSPGAAHKAGKMEPEQGVHAGDVDLTGLLEAPPEERDFIRRLGPEVGLAVVIPAPEETPDPMAPGSALEAVPLSSWLKRGLMRVLRRESTVPRGLTGRRCTIRTTHRRANEAISLPAIKVGLRRLLPTPDGPATEGGPG